MTQTDLKLIGIGFPPFSSRSCQQTLELISRGELKRTVNGKLVTLGNDKTSKYRTVIQGTDIHSPGFESIHPGQDIHVHCLHRVWQEVLETSIELKRPYVTGSLVAVTQDGKPISLVKAEGQQVEIDPSSPLPFYLSYCPILEMKVISFSSEVEEWKMETRWKLVLEEV
jgi:hypothetical protein